MVSPNLKPPPTAVDCEKRTLGSIFVDGTISLSRILEGHITADCYSDPFNRLLFQTFLWLHRNNKQLSLDIVFEELRRTHKLESFQADGVTPMQFLLEVSRSTPTTAELEYDIERVRDTYVQRELILTAETVAIAARDETFEVEKFTQQVDRILSIRHATQKIKTLPVATLEAIDRAVRIRNRAPMEQDVGLEYPWKEFNEHMGEAKPGELTIVAARPGIGKSSIARQCMLAWAQRYGNVALFSREMPVDQLAPLFAQIMCRHSWKDFRKPQLFPRDEDAFIAALHELSRIKTLHVYDRDRTLSHVMARAKSIAQSLQLKAIAIDYLQRYDPEMIKGETRDIALGRMTMGFKDMAMDLKLPVMLLAQVGRGYEREKREPRLSDLRESGNIEQDADNVIFIHVPEIDPLTKLPQDPFDDTVKQLYVEVIQAKGRSEGRSRCAFYFHKPTTCFLSINPSNDNK